MDVDYSIPEDASPAIAAALAALIEELEEGDITLKGYSKRRDQLLAQIPSISSQSSGKSTPTASYNSYGFSPATTQTPLAPAKTQESSRSSYHGASSIHAASINTSMDTFSDQLSMRHPSGTRTSSSSVHRPGIRPKASTASLQPSTVKSTSQLNLLPSALGASLGNKKPLGALEKPLPPRGIPDTARSDPLNSSVNLSNFDNLPSILRHRGQTNADIIAFSLLDAKGKDVQFLTWGKLAAKSEKVAQHLRESARLFRGDRVVLMYSELEPLEFVVALMGCFIAGFVAVPLLPAQIMELPNVLQSTKSKLVVSSESVQKFVHRNHQNMLIKLKDVKWLKSSDWGSYNLKRGDLPPLQVPDLAYIDYARSPFGELRGVVMSHRTILHQMTSLTAMLQSRSAPKKLSKRAPDRLLCSLEARRSTGLLIGLLHTIYSGNSTTFIPPKAMVTPGLYAHIITRSRISILLSDYPALKQVTYNYQSEPEATRNFKKGFKVNLSTLRWCLIDAATVDNEFQMVIAERWLKPLGNQAGSEIVTPMLTLAEHGGMVIAMHDGLSSGDTAADERVDDELHLDRKALMSNTVQVVDSNNSSDALVVRSFGFPIPDATLAVVDPETHTLSEVDTIGEIWIDSPSLSGGYWALPEETEANFHANCFDESSTLGLEFLRTGLLGFTKNKRLYVLGPLEDRLIQVSYHNKSNSNEGANETTTTESSPSDSGVSVSDANGFVDQLHGRVRYYFSSHLVYTIMRRVSRCFEACVFQIPVAERLLSIVVIETPLALVESNVALNAKNTEKRDIELDEIAQQVIAVLRGVHSFTAYCVVMTQPNATPRIIRSGRPDIAKLLARKFFLAGSFPAQYVKFDVESCIDWLPQGADIKGGIWSPAMAYIRAESLDSKELQLSGVDMRDHINDDRSQVSLNQFKTIIDVLKWRLSRQPDELAYLSLSGNGGEITKEWSWKSLCQSVATAVGYLKDHLRLRAGDVALLMYTHGISYVVAVLACFTLGVTVIPFPTINLERVEEDISSLFKVYSQLKVSVLLGNHQTQSIMEDKAVTTYLKQRSLTIGKLHNTAKLKTSPLMNIEKIAIDAKISAPNFPALVWLNWTPDNDFSASRISHKAILGMCGIQKETCQLSSTRPLLSCVRSNNGIGFLYTCCLGIFVGASSILVSPVDFANQPSIYFITTSRYKIKDGYATNQMLRHALRVPKYRGFTLDSLQNLIVTSSDRAQIGLSTQVRAALGPLGLPPAAISTAYSCNGNIMVTTRSYMQLDPIDIWIDPIALRQGYVLLVNPANCQSAIHLQDSGMVPVNTQIAIVNPGTQTLCRAGEFGEIWVMSDGNQSGLYHTDILIEKEVMEGTIAGSDGSVKYMRTGDYGFLHTIIRSQDLEMQVLYVLGPISRCFEVNGLHHFAIDIEDSIPQCHSSIQSAAVFVIGPSEAVTLLVETTSKVDRLSNLSTLIVNHVLLKHQFVLDSVVFVAKNAFPRSRLGEIQRRHLLSKYISGKLSYLGQFGVQPQG